MPYVTQNGQTQWVGPSDPPKPCCGQTVVAAQPTIGICDVCRLVDHDETTKPVRYCGSCSAWICNACWPDLVKRAKAMALRVAEKILPQDASNA